MHRELVERLATPGGAGRLELDPRRVGEDDHVIDGDLVSPDGERFPIVDGVPRFVGAEAYASSFGAQWNRWSHTQHDSHNGTLIFRSRFERYFGSTEQLQGLDVLDAGCGPGGFIDVVAPYVRSIVGADLSRAVEAAASTFKGRREIDIVQADIFQLPFPDASFDFVYSIGVLQHTPDPGRAFAGLARLVKPGGTLAVWVYERHRREALKPRHLLRRYTAGMPEQRGMRFVERYYRVAGPLRRGLKRLPGLPLEKLVPVIDLADYPDDLPSKLTPSQRAEWELMDTHDMLVTTYDSPQWPATVASWFRAHGMEPHHAPAAEAIAMTGVRPGQPSSSL